MTSEPPETTLGTRTGTANVYPEEIKMDDTFRRLYLDFSELIFGIMNISVGVKRQSHTLYNSGKNLCIFFETTMM